MTKNRKGELEVRNLLSRGKYVMYDYRDPKTFRSMQNQKKKLYLMDGSGKVKEFYIIPMKSKSLLVKPKVVEEKKRFVWNEREGKAKPLWE